MVRYQLPIPNRPNMDDVGVELSEPPPGLSLVRVIRGPGGLVMLISADAEIGQAWSAGQPDPERLCRTHGPRSQRPARRQASRLARRLPPVPFEVVER